MEPSFQPEPQKSNKGLMIGVGGIAIVVLLCCCLAIVVIAAMTIMGPVIGNVFSTINNSLLTPSVPDFSTLPATPDISDIPTLSSDVSDLIPQGGRGDEILRASAWAQVILSTSLEGCSYNPNASDTQIEVTQEPDSSGVWEEQWAVTCDDGSTKPYNVTFTPTTGGSAEINVTSGQ